MGNNKVDCNTSGGIWKAVGQANRNLIILFLRRKPAYLLIFRSLTFYGCQSMDKKLFELC